MSEADLALPATDPRRCATPAGEPISVEVVPQLTQRRAHDVVHLSCRCDGPDPQASYCACPAGFSCTHLIDDVGLGGEYAGSYCIREGTAYDPDADYGPVCERSAAPGTAGHCD
jgi:hypothetical protein